LSRNAFLNSSFKNTPSILPQFTPKKWQFFASLMFGPSLDLLPSIALLRRMGGGWDLDLAVFLNALAPATPVNRRQGRSNPVNQFQEKKIPQNRASFEASQDSGLWTGDSFYPHHSTLSSLNSQRPGPAHPSASKRNQDFQRNLKFKTQNPKLHESLANQQKTSQKTLKNNPKKPRFLNYSQPCAQRSTHPALNQLALQTTDCGLRTRPMLSLLCSILVFKNGGRPQGPNILLQIPNNFTNLPDRAGNTSRNILKTKRL